MKKNKYEIDMCNGSIMDKLISFSLPLMLSGILQLMFNAVDIVVVGRFSGSEALAAVGSTTALINVFTNLFIGISLGANVLAARFYAAGLNITDYVAIDFNALVTVVDCLGGLDIPLSYAEIVHMNNYCVETSEETGKSYTPIELPDPKPEDEEAIVDTYHLNGVQATSYCRIRYTASLDMGRTERQRRVIQMIVDKAKKAGLSTIFDIMDQVFPMVKTSVSKTEILKMIPAMIGYSIDETTGFPNDYKFAQVKGSVIVPTTLESNVLKMHQFLYGDTSYTPTQDVLNRSAQITNIAGGGDVQDTAPAVTDTPNDATDDSYTWQGDTSTDYSSTDTSDDADYSTDTDYDSDYSGDDYSTDTDYSGDDYSTDTDDSDTDYSDYTDGEDYSENE